MHLRDIRWQLSKGILQQWTGKTRLLVTKVTNMYVTPSPSYPSFTEALRNYLPKDPSRLSLYSHFIDGNLRPKEMKWRAEDNHGNLRLIQELNLDLLCQCYTTPNNWPSGILGEIWLGKEEEHHIFQMCWFLERMTGLPWALARHQFY